MASNYKTSVGAFENTDLDDIFEPISVGIPILEEFTTGGDTWRDIDSSLGQGFKVSITKTCTKISVYLRSSPSTTVILHIATNDGGEPGSVLGSTSPITVTSAGWYEGTISPVELTSAVQYHIVVDPDVDGWVDSYLDSNNGYSDGKAQWFDSYTFNWYDLTGNYDTYFKLYGEEAIPVDPTNIKVNGIDLNERYESIELGNPPAATGYKVSGSDLNTIFAAKDS